MPLLNLFFLLLIILSSGYFLIMAIVITGLLRRKSVLPESKNPTTRVTVIIAARNEEKRITGCLNGLRNQDYPTTLLEIIMVDDVSEDGTREVINAFIRNNPGLQMRCLIKEGAPSKKAALAIAMMSATGDLIITSDADSIPAPHWVSSIVDCYESAHPAMIIGPVTFADEKQLFTGIQSLEFMGLIGATAGSALAGIPLMCNGANLAYEKKAFEAVSGFSGNEKYASGDDQFLMMKIRKHFGRKSVRFLFDKSAIVKTPAAATFRAFWHQRLRWVSKSKGYTDKKVLLVAVMTYLANLIILTGFFIPGISMTALILFGIKMIMDFIPVAVMAVFFEKKRWLFLFPAAAILNLMYTVVIGFMGTFGSYEWKGRTVPVSRSSS